MSMLCTLPFAAALFSSCAAPAPLAVGYVEGEYVLLAPLETAQLRSLEVRRGDRVEAGEVLAALENEATRFAVAEAEAALAQAEAQLADLKLGKRPEEIAVLDAALRSAEAAEAEARRVLERTRDLHRRGIATQAELDKATTAAERAEAAVGEAKAQRAVAELPARRETIEAASSQVERARASLKQSRWRHEQRVLHAPATGRIADVIRTPGDLAGPNAPVLSLLPDGAVKLKLYVPEPEFSSIAVGETVEVRCDGCPDGLAARISYAAPEPEFTPPVIYSLETRQKLVHLVEARPVGDTQYLKPGQIVDVVLAKR